jgi:deazaflavin-dependent oxidoreductase (nitroreductase family)
MTFPRALARCTRGAVNKMTLHLAGHSAFADLEHTGRKSGMVRHTPVRAFRAGDMVIIGLNFGRQSDWYQNIKAAGHCRIRLAGEQLTLGAPALVPTGQAAKDIPWLFSFAFRHVVHTAECVQLPILHSSPVAATRRQHPTGTRAPAASVDADRNMPGPRSPRAARRRRRPGPPAAARLGRAGTDR